MALVRPSIDLEAGLLNVNLVDSSSAISIPLASSAFQALQSSASRVCGDKINALVYAEAGIVEFFSTAIGVPCTLARFPASLASKRHFKPHLSTPVNGDAGLCAVKSPPILLSNESPILLVNRTSVDLLNEEIKNSGGKMAKVDVFRANIVIAETGPKRVAYAEDTWKHLQIGKEFMEVRSIYHICFWLSSIINVR